MFRKCLFLKLFVISIVHFSFNQLYAQEEGEIITISERAGKKIDHEERGKFRLFVYHFKEIQERKYQNQNLSKHQTVSSASKEKKIYFTFRLGQGGFYDDRSEIGKLGGGQLTLDIKPGKYPVGISISSEYYTNSADPTHSYEIARLTAINMLYMTKPFKSERVNVFLGGGVGGLEVPKGENEPDDMVNGFLYNFEGGINVRLFWKIGFYGTGKYLYAKKKSNSIKVIDFSELIVLLGFTLNFGL